MNTNQNNQPKVVIVGAARTPSGRFQGQFASVAGTALGAAAIRAAVDRAGVDPASIYEVIMGHVVSAGSGQAPARMAAIGAGLPPTVGAMAVNKVCGSGLKAVMLASNAIVAGEGGTMAGEGGTMAGEGGTMVAGGFESMSRAPYLMPKARTGLRYGHAQVKDSLVHDGLWCSFEDWAMGNAAEYIAREFELERAALDEYAFRSHEKAAAATAAGRFDAEITPVTVKGRRGKVTVCTIDEPIRATYADTDYTMGTSVESLGRLRPAFEKDGIVTAGNAPGLNDGGAAVVLMNEVSAEAQNIKPLARIVGYTHAAVEPRRLFAAPAKAMPLLAGQWLTST